MWPQFGRPFRGRVARVDAAARLRVDNPLAHRRVPAAGLRLEMVVAVDPHAVVPAPIDGKRRIGHHISESHRGVAPEVAAVVHPEGVVRVDARAEDAGGKRRGIERDDVVADRPRTPADRTAVRARDIAHNRVVADQLRATVQPAAFALRSIAGDDVVLDPSVAGVEPAAFGDREVADDRVADDLTVAEVQPAGVGVVGDQVVANRSVAVGDAGVVVGDGVAANRSIAGEDPFQLVGDDGIARDGRGGIALAGDTCALAISDDVLRYRRSRPHAEDAVSSDREALQHGVAALAKVEDDAGTGRSGDHRRLDHRRVVRGQAAHGHTPAVEDNPLTVCSRPDHDDVAVPGVVDRLLDGRIVGRTVIIHGNRLCQAGNGRNRRDQQHNKPVHTEILPPVNPISTSNHDSKNPRFIQALRAVPEALSAPADRDLRSGNTSARIPGQLPPTR